MDAFDGPVCLTRMAPHPVYSDQLIFYDVIDRGTYSRSGVLSCIVESGGAATLPDTITLAQFKIWITAIQEGHEKAKTLPFASLCTVVKVADALDDTRIQVWVDMTAACLIQRVTSNTTYSNEAPEQTITSLYQLPDLLQQRILVAASRDPLQLQHLLAFLPTNLHQTMLAAIMKPEKSLTLPLPLHHSLRLIRAMASCPWPVLSFNLSAGMHDYSAGAPSAILSNVWQEAAPCLLNALHHHSSLIRLNLFSQSMDAATVKFLLPAIGTLKFLESLHLQAFVDTEAALMLQTTLEVLPRLQDLNLSVSEAPESFMRFRAEALEAPPQHGLADLLSAATNLSSLTFRASGARYNSVAVAPLCLPLLKQLNIAFRRSDAAAAAALPSHLSAPLTSLTVIRAPSPPPDPGPATAADVQLLFDSIASFTLLRCLDVMSPYHCTDAFQDAVDEFAPPAIAALHQLQDLHIQVGVHRAVSLLAAGGIELTRLCAYIPSRHRDPIPAPSWSEFCNHLCRLRLQHLDLRMGLIPFLEKRVGIVGLQGLSQLTALRLESYGWAWCTADFNTLACMTHLRKLHLVNLEIPPDLHTQCMRSLAELHALTSFAHQSEDPEDDFAGALIKHVPAGAWPAVQQLVLNLRPPYDAFDAVLHFVRQLPALTLLVFDLQDTGLYEGYMERYRCVLEMLAALSDASGIAVSTARAIPF